MKISDLVNERAARQIAGTAVKLSDYVISFLADAGVRHAFVVQGGAIAHLVDSIAKHSGINYVCVGHEQAGALAAHGYAGVTKDGLACALATTGPGILNLLNGIATLYYDSFPGIFIGGQVTTGRYRAKELGIRQLGFQESPHAELAAPITKYSATVTRAADIRYELEKALYMARSGRPGPVFLDICDDVQRQEIDPASLRSFNPDREPTGQTADADLDRAIERMLDLLSAAERPVLALGAGVRVAGAARESIQLAEKLGVPVLWSWGAMDFLPASHPLNAGGFGVHSPRFGNFTVQNADLLIGVGIRLSQHQTGSPTSTFARAAKRVVVDVDPNEISKLPTLGFPIDVPVCCDAARFLARVRRFEGRFPRRDLSGWLGRIADWRARYSMRPIAPPAQAKPLDPYYFMAELSRKVKENAVVFGDVGASLSWMYQAFQVKQGQTVLTSFNNHTMGYALPASIGAALADPQRLVVSLNGDGSILMNIQELGTLAMHRLPVKVFILNNHGYGVIQQTQEDYFGGRYNGVDPASGLMDPDFPAIARGFGVKTVYIRVAGELAAGLEAVFADREPVVCVVEIDPTTRIVPAVRNMRPIEDIAPFLPREELARNMIIPMI